MVVSNIFFFASLFGEDFPFDLRIFFRWVGEKPPTRYNLARNFMEKKYPWQFCDRDLFGMVSSCDPFKGENMTFNWEIKRSHKWLFQLDDSKSLLGKLLFHHFHPFKT